MLRCPRAIAAKCSAAATSDLPESVGAPRMTFFPATIFEQRLLLRRVEVDPALGDVLEEALEDRVVVRAARGNAAAEGVVRPGGHGGATLRTARAPPRSPAPGAPGRQASSTLRTSAASAPGEKGFARKFSPATKRPCLAMTSPGYPKRNSTLMEGLASRARARRQRGPVEPGIITSVTSRSTARASQWRSAAAPSRPVLRREHAVAARLEHAQRDPAHGGVVLGEQHRLPPRGAARDGAAGRGRVLGERGARGQEDLERHAGAALALDDEVAPQTGRQNA